MKKITFIFLIFISNTLTCTAQADSSKGFNIEFKYNFAPKFANLKSNSFAVEVLLENRVYLNYSYSIGDYLDSTSSNLFWKYRTSLVELRFDILKENFNTSEIRFFIGPYIRFKNIDRSRPERQFYFSPKIRFTSDAIGVGGVGGLNYAFKKQFSVEVKVGAGYSSRYSVEGNDFPVFYRKHPFDGVAGLSLGYNFGQIKSKP